MIVFLIPAVMILCNCMGIKGVLWAGPVVDGLAFFFAFVLIFAEVKKINYLAQEKGDKEQMAHYASKCVHCTDSKKKSIRTRMEDEKVNQVVR